MTPRGGEEGEHDWPALIGSTGTPTGKWTSAMDHRPPCSDGRRVPTYMMRDAYDTPYLNAALETSIYDRSELHSYK